jgi:Ca2+-transporting ATPase
LLNALTARSERHSIFNQTTLPSNPFLTTALIGSFGLQALTFIVPWLQSLLRLTPITLLDGVVIGASALLPFVVNEATKTSEVASRDGVGAKNTPHKYMNSSDPFPDVQR